MIENEARTASAITRPCRTSRCQQREQCIIKYQTDPDNYQSWLESKGDAYKASCADIPDSTNKFA